jgi:hypothetical protein
MRVCGGLLVLVFLMIQPLAAVAETPRELVEQAAQTELAASRNDHSCWLYYEVDSKPTGTVKQWVAETHYGNLHRVLEENGQALSPAAQRRRMDNFIRNTQAQAKQRKAGQHDDKQAAEMLGLLPNAFVWKVTGRHDSETTLHFTPDPNFEPPDWETRVFAAMEGNMTISNSQHRIVSLQGRLIHDVKFFFGIFGDLKAGGTFDVERRETGPSVWQITQTHVHIQGYALLFKNISQQEDDVLTRFKPLPQNITLQQAEDLLLEQHS